MPDRRKTGHPLARRPAVPAAVAALLLCGALAAGPAGAAQVADPPPGMSASDTDELKNLDTEDDVDVVFKPPVDGAPGDRVGAGTRDGTSLVRRVVLLAPKGGGLTTSATPKLYWWLAKAFEGTIEIKVEPVDDKKTVLEVRRPISAEAGLQLLDLETLGLSLDEGRIYVWKLVLKTKEDVGWASGLSFVERVAPPEGANAENPVGRAKALAAAGIWYDALATVAENPALENQRASLLTSAGLTFVLGQ